MNIIIIIVSLALAYLLGSIPTAVWVGKAFHDIDVREHGSGNAGATNVIRVLGWKTGVPVLLVDMAKGSIAALLPLFLHIAESGSPQLINLQIFNGLSAIVGHMFPVFAGFRGGKGVATAAGSIAAIHPYVTIICLGVFILVFILTGIVSVSSMSAGIAFPVMLFTFFNTPSLLFKIFSVFIAVAMLITHRENIKRLLKGEEKRLFGKKTKE
jgi:glycerol-3-phosphate acyltransferase PlsY